MYKKIAAGGCSNSSFNWGNPWHVFMGKDYDSEVISYSSIGAGNEMNVEKIKFILENNKLDLMVCQLTEPSRFVVGTSVGENEDGLHSTNIFQDSYYYTFNAHNNNNHLKRIFGKEYDVDEFLLSNVIPSRYNLNYKIFHTMLTIKGLCDLYGVKVYFFSWFVDLKKLAVESNYDRVIQSFNILDGCVIDFIYDNGLNPLPDGHYGSNAHSIIYNSYIKPQLNYLINRTGNKLI